CLVCVTVVISSMKMMMILLGGPQADTSPAKNYAVEIPPKEYSPGITALQAYLSHTPGLSQPVQEPAPPGVTSHHDHWQAPAR
ncbi:unnamed protein product, partial [Sphacelaria rigidula]